MAKEQSVARKPSRSKGDTQKKAGAKTGRKGRDDGVSSRERELAGYLQKRIKPGLNSGAIPLLARSIAKEIAHQESPSNGSQRGGADEEPKAGSGEQPKGASDEPKAESDEQPKGASGEEPKAESDEQPKAGSDDGSRAGSDDDSDADEAEAPDFEADMHDLQAELGEHWILRFSVHGDDAWLTAEMDDGSQRIEAPTAAVLADAVALLNEGGGRSG